MVVASREEEEEDEEEAGKKGVGGAYYGCLFVVCMYVCRCGWPFHDQREERRESVFVCLTVCLVGDLRGLSCQLVWSASIEMGCIATGLSVVLVRLGGRAVDGSDQAAIVA